MNNNRSWIPNSKAMYFLSLFLIENENFQFRSFSRNRGGNNEIKNVDKMALIMTFLASLLMISCSADQTETAREKPCIKGSSLNDKTAQVHRVGRRVVY